MNVLFDFCDGSIHCNNKTITISYNRSLFNRLFKKSVVIIIQTIKNISYIKTAQHVRLTLHFEKQTKTIYFSNKSSVFMKFIDQLLAINNDIKVIEKLVSNPCESDACCYYKNE